MQVYFRAAGYQKGYPGVNFIKVLRAAFMLVDPKSPNKDSQVVSLSYAFWDLHVQKLLVER